MKKIFKSIMVIAASILLGNFVSCSDGDSSSRVEINYATLPESVGVNELKGKSFGNSQLGRAADATEITFTFNAEGNELEIESSSEGMKTWYEYSYNSEEGLIYLAAKKVEMTDEDTGETEVYTIEEAVSQCEASIREAKKELPPKNKYISGMLEFFKMQNPDATSAELNEYKTLCEKSYNMMISSLTYTFETIMIQVRAIAENVTAYKYVYDENDGTLELTQKFYSDTDIQTIPYLYEIENSVRKNGNVYKFKGPMLKIMNEDDYNFWGDYDFDDDYSNGDVYIGTFKGKNVVYTKLSMLLMPDESDTPLTINAIADYSEEKGYSITLIGDDVDNVTAEFDLEYNTFVLTELK